MAENHEPAKAYLRNKILNASPMALIIILYEGAIASCARAREVFGAKAFQHVDRPLVVDVLVTLAPSTQHRVAGRHDEVAHEFIAGHPLRQGRRT